MFGLLDGLYRNYDASFMVEPDLGKMSKLVYGSQETFKSSNATFVPASYMEANSKVTEYARICSYVGMDELLDKALDAGAQAVSIDASRTNFMTSAERQALAVPQEKARVQEELLAAKKREKEAREGLERLESEHEAQPEGPTEPAVGG